jgi:hypothetical protein
MYSTFIDLGFMADEFYADSDADTFDYLNRIVREGDGSDLLRLLPDYLTLIAPGGSLHADHKEDLKAAFRQLSCGQYRSAFDSIDQAIIDWTSCPSYHPRQVLATILQTLRDPCLTWFGHSGFHRPPTDGFFVDEEFEVQADE